MKIELLYFDGCLHKDHARQLLREVLTEEKVGAWIQEIRVETDEDARRLRFLGSPTIRIEGMDVERWGEQPSDYGSRCRVYRHNGQTLDHPPKEMIRSTILAVRDVEEFGVVGCC